MLQLNLLLIPSQVMLDFQAAERQSLEEPASDVGLETLCALVRSFLSLVCTFSCSMSVLAPPNYAEQVLMSHQAWSLDSFTFSNLLWR